MNKQEFVLRTSVLLSTLGRGTASEAEVFRGAKHDDICKRLIAFLGRHKHLLPHDTVELTQGWNDRGTDVILKHGDIFIGFQIKSHDDVKQQDFVAKVKQQLTDSFSNNLAKWYLLICAPADETPKRVNHILCDIAALHIRYPAAYSPLNCCRIFADNATVNDADFAQSLQAHSYQDDDSATMLKHLKELIKFAGGTPESATNALPELPTVSLSAGQSCTSANALAAAHKWRLTDEERAETVRQLNELLNKLRTIPRRSRSFYARLLQMLPDPDSPHVRPQVVERHLQMSAQEVATEAVILEEAGLIDYRRGPVDGDDPALITVCDVEDLPVAATLRPFSTATGVPLEAIVEHLEFNKLD